MRDFKVALFTSTAVVLAMTSCVPPDAVVRKDAGFTRESSLTLTGGADPAILVPDLERELLRRGFNIISESVAQVETQTTVMAGDKVAAKEEASKNAYQNSAQASAVTSGSSNTITSTHRTVRSKFEGRVTYLYSPSTMSVRRVNLTITELETGKVAVSIVFDSSLSHDAVATNIADQLAKVVQ